MVPEHQRLDHLTCASSLVFVESMLAVFGHMTFDSINIDLGRDTFDKAPPSIPARRAPR